MKRLEPEWLSYKADVVPRDAGSTQIEECRRAFYAGAASLYMIATTMLDPGSGVTDADVKKMEDLSQELEEFKLAVMSSQTGKPN